MEEESEETEGEQSGEESGDTGPTRRNSPPRTARGNDLELIATLFANRVPMNPRLLGRSDGDDEDDVKVVKIEARSIGQRGVEENVG